MDSRIEEFAQAIYERAEFAAENVRKAADGYRGDRYHSWRSLQNLAKSMLDVVNDYRKAHPEEYADGSLEMRDLTEQIVQLRGQLKNYQEREKTMGWAAQ